MKRDSLYRQFFVISVFSLFILCPCLVHSQQADLVKGLFGKFEWRNIGPAVMGGRTVDIDVVEKKPWIIYAAVGPSGVWRTENNGITWEPVFYKEKTVSVGDVTIAQSHPEIIWVGTGEATCRNSVTIGDGVYKSTDGGKTWTNMGLEETRHISRIVINPGDPNIVYVAAMGHLWGPNIERGVYKTLDGGKSWTKALYVNETTGFADLVMDPYDSLTLYAAAYDHQRYPYYFRSGGPGSGIYKTTDGGQSWSRLTKDLPEGLLGRIGLEVSKSNPNIVYALIEHKDGGIWRSEDKGKSWKRMCDNKTFVEINFRPFYYSQIRVDPKNDKIVYVYSGGCFRSEDSGKTFTVISTGTHSDHHVLWVDSSNPLHLIDGNDGGIDITYDGGKTWQAIQHMDTAEVYQVGFDMRNPYHVYCGLQDNGVWGGPSATVDHTGITNDDWYAVGGGDGFYIQADPTDPNIVYGNSQMNGLYRYDGRIRLSKDVRPLASLKEPPYRFNWNSPVYISPHDSKTIYTGGNYLFRTTDGGHFWEVISPDLTTNAPGKQKDSGGPITPDNTGAEIHCTIYTISESPVKKGVIWCGTDDGNVQLTMDGGMSWTNVVKNIKGLPLHTWCSRIEASHFDAGTAYASFDGHRNDDYSTHVYKTSDFGRTWISIKGNLPFGWVHVIREDLKNKNLLFAGTEFGIYASLDGGKSWFSFQNNLATVAVHDIAIHPRENDLIIGTHGRGIWILDDISPLQNMTEEVLQSKAYLFPIKPVTEFYLSSSRESFTRPDFAGKNPFYGMTIAAYFKEKPKERPKVFIRNQEGKEIFQIHLATKEGLQRAQWNLQFVPRTKEGERTAPSSLAFISLPLAPAGEYTVEMVEGEQKIVQKGIVLPDPRFSFDKESQMSQLETIAEFLALDKIMGLSVTSAKSIRRQIDKLKEDLDKGKEVPKVIHTAVNSFEEKFQILEDDVIPKEFFYRGSREIALRGGSLSQQLMMLGVSLGGYPSAPTETDLSQLQNLKEAIGVLVGRLNAMIGDDLVKCNKILEENGYKPFRAPREAPL